MDVGKVRLRFVKYRMKIWDITIPWCFDFCHQYWKAFSDVYQGMNGSTVGLKLKVACGDKGS
jgi:hypothetical protein